MRLSLAALLLLLTAATARAGDGNRLTYLDELDPYYPSRTFPKLITPQWVGEEGVEAVVILAIDDMRGPEKWEAYLRPILERLKRIDGRAPVSIMTCQVDPKHPHLQKWLQEGVSLECHTIDHPCPLLRDGDFAKAKSTYDRCVDLMNEVPGSKPVAFRTPCCDSLNTVSPRFFAEIFNKTTPKKNYLSIDSSVFNVFTSNDPDLPRELVQDADGQDKFLKYLPSDRTFVNTIENYPYPYAVGKRCWEFPCVTPSDWSAQHYHKPRNPITVRDWKAALDATVIKQGVFCLVFHPYDWVKNEQVVELIDHAVSRHSKKVKFLTFREAFERLNRNYWAGKPLRNTNSESDRNDAGIRFVDVDGDGQLDKIISNEKEYGIYLFTSKAEGWSRRVIAGKQGEPGSIPPISRNGTNNGFFVHSRHLWWQNENTNLLKDHVARVSFNDLLKDVEPTAKTPEASLKAIQTRPGFQVEQVAAEPLVMDPINFAFGPDGKLWVVEMGDYPKGGDGKGKPAGRVRCLEATKGDGKYEKSTVFLDDLSFPTSVLPWRKGVLVTCAPDILYAEDTDGDGKADKREVLYTGFTPGNPQHRVNSLVWGLDNWIYVANGDSGGRVKSVKNGKVVDLRGRDLRIRPDTGELELQSGQTQYGRSRDDWGNWFGGNNSNPLWHFALDEHYLRRNPHVAAPDPRVPVSVAPGAAPVYPVSRTLPRFNDFNTANHFTSACSPIVYRDELLGPHFAGNTFVCEPVHNLVHREIMTPSGTTFTSRRAVDEQRSEFLASADNWFRPTTVQTGPDGALWIADMYRHVIEHPEWIPLEWQKKLDLRAGHDKGRIYRVFPVGSKPRAIPKLDKLDTAGLVAALDSPSGWQRDTVQMMLLWRNDRAAVPLLEQMTTDCQRPLGRLHALCTLDGLNALTPAVLQRILADAHPGVRRHAVRLSEPFLNEHDSLAADVARRRNDADAQVRIQVAYTLGEWNKPSVGMLLAKLAAQYPEDRLLIAAVMSSVNKTNLETLLSELLSASAKGKPLPPGLLESTLRMVVASDDWRLLNNMSRGVAAPSNRMYAPWQYTTLGGLLDAAALRSDDAIKSKWDLKQFAGLFDAARKLAADKESQPADRRLAIRLLGRGPDHVAEDVATLASLLTPQTAEDLRTTAVEALGRLRGPDVPAALLRGWKGYGPTLRSHVLDILLRRDEWLNELLSALEKKQVLPNEIDAARRQRLLTHRTARVRETANLVFAGAVNADRQKVIEAYQSALTLKGDAARGAPLFAKHCSACHKLGNVGNAVGPDLASVGDKSPEGLLIAMLDPNRAVEARYVNYVAQTKNGLTFTGVLASETGNSVTLVGPDGKPNTIARADLEELAGTDKSAMPEGLEKDLQPQDVADLIAHIRAGLPPPERRDYAGNQPTLVTPAADGSLSLKAATAEIYGSNVQYELQYGNLGFWRHEDDAAVWSVEVPRAGKYVVRLDYACAPECAGNAFVLQAGVRELRGKVASTGGWDSYRDIEVGTMELTAGRQRVTFRSAGRISQYLIDLRTVRLVPK